jgi:hypothetical protein
MSTTTVLNDDIATVVREEVPNFSLGAVIAGAAIAAAVGFFLVSLGAGLGLALTSAHTATLAGAKTFLTLGAIYFMAAQAFGFAVGGHVTGRLMPILVEDNEEENFRADAHGLAVWAMAVIFGLMLAAVAAFATGSTAASKASAPAIYWADKLLTPANTAPSDAGMTAPVDGSSSDNAVTNAAAMPPVTGGTLTSGTLADAKAEAARLLTVDVGMSSSEPSNVSRLSRLVVQYAGLPSSAAAQRVRQTEDTMRARAKDAAEAARKAASYLAIWTAISLLFGAVVCIAATVSARWTQDHKIHGSHRV